MGTKNSASSWSKSIDFHCTFGVWPFRKTLDITPAGVQYCGELFPFGTITRLRWGIDQKRGGVFPKVVYNFVFGTDTREITIRTKEKDFYEQLTEHIWRAVGSRLLSAMLTDLHQGRTREFGDFTVDDLGITVRQGALFGHGEKKHFAWNELKWGVINGQIVFTKNDKPDLPIASASFLHSDNAHLLTIALAVLQKSADKTSLSSAETKL